VTILGIVTSPRVSGTVDKFWVKLTLRVWLKMTHTVVFISTVNRFHNSFTAVDIVMCCDRRNQHDVITSSTRYHFAFSGVSIPQQQQQQQQRTAVTSSSPSSVITKNTDGSCRPTFYTIEVIPARTTSTAVTVPTAAVHDGSNQAHQSVF